MYTILFMTQAKKDAKRLGASGLKEKALKLIKIFKDDPYKYPPEFEYLNGDMKG